MNQQITPIRRALISVSDKHNILELSKTLVSMGVEILSTGGTAKLLKDNGVDVTLVQDYTGFAEIMDGRVKTLHPKIHGGLLGRRGQDDEVMQAHGIVPIDLVIINLYPFEQTIAKQNCTFEDAIENIDVGGPAMLRASAKNHQYVTVCVDPSDYDTVIQQMKDSGGSSVELRKQLAQKAFAMTARYDGLIANYLGQQDNLDYPTNYSLQYEQAQILRYGENPHQSAAFYKSPYVELGTISGARLLQGKAMSFNNLVDADTAWLCVNEFNNDRPSHACVIVKHANPCGVALADTSLESYERAYASDPTSAFGGIIAFNHELDEETAKHIIKDGKFLEVIIAPSFDEGATQVLASKSNIRVLETGQLYFPNAQTHPNHEIKTVGGGLLVQQTDTHVVAADSLQVATKNQPTTQQIGDLIFAWKVAKFTKSNAIVYVKDRQTIGIGAGQMSRVYSAKIAALKAADEGFDLSDVVMASDAFFPFRDAIDAANEVGVTAIIQPGGSIRDDEVIGAANEHNMTMVFTGVRHFRH